MSLEEEEYFTIIWRIKNFSMCPVEFGHCIESPVIRVRKFGNSEWSLVLYPKGKAKNDFAGCYLKCNSLGDYSINIHVIFYLSIYPMEINRTRLVGDFRCTLSGGIFNWFPLEDIFREREKCLPNDTFTMKCSLKCEDPVVPKKIEEELIHTLAWDCGKIALNLNKCCVETTIDVQNNTILWPIRRFLSLSKNNRQVLPVFSSVKKVPSFYVTVCKSRETGINIEMSRKNDEDFSKKVFTRCSISVLNATRDINICFDGEYLFKSDESWSFPLMIEYGELKEDEYFESTGGTLYLQFDFTFSFEGEMHHSEIHDRVSLPIKIKSPVDVFNTSTSNDEPKVVALRAGDTTFTVHKALLETKSEVFHAMFENDMQEKNTGVVDVPDVEPQTLGRMLSFLYSGSTASDLSVADVGKLYAAADKYLVQPLIEYCSSVMMSSLTVSNVCDILIMADLYRNDRLLKCAADFVVAVNDPERLLMSADWKKLMENNGTVAANIMYKMLIK